MWPKQQLEWVPVALDIPLYFNGTEFSMCLQHKTAYFEEDDGSKFLSNKLNIHSQITPVILSIDNMFPWMDYQVLAHTSMTSNCLLNIKCLLKP